MSPLVPQVRLDAQETEGFHLPMPQRDADVADKQRSRKAAFHHRGQWPATKGTSSEFDRTSGHRRRQRPRCPVPPHGCSAFSNLSWTSLVTHAGEHFGDVVGDYGFGLELLAGQSDGDVLQGAQCADDPLDAPAGTAARVGDI